MTNANELLPIIYADELAKPLAPRGGPWGRWTFRADNMTLQFRAESGMRNEVDLERCETSEGVLAAIERIRWKAWATPEDVGHLAIALADIRPVIARHQRERTAEQQRSAR
jgi:hypothetical protein